ncbi:MAG: hypothetical protein V4533_03225 [Pseudomonadota bacterium]|jgi:hypothetical protein|uniref:hypothetical protein n=1 Tax=Sphingobium sp. CECT 9361 TaxID=2845384 RepID=UPI001E30A762|nr:hypothetical protein [Sphingobium sp. CECT 9361]CAH0356472.1 hypothetical protein SPH9361_04114 [Sphingobium sp. CECT 9361]|tara:strand:+ start:26256 stop:26522 length:267 start_codon:yes stop_codon:yes gene_type:complete
MAEEGEKPDLYGALVGWSSQDLGDKLLVKLQVMETAQDKASNHPRSYFLLLTSNQATILGTYLFQKSGATPRTRKSSWFRRLLGRTDS